MDIQTMQKGDLKLVINAVKGYNESGCQKDRICVHQHSLQLVNFGSAAGLT